MYGYGRKENIPDNRYLFLVLAKSPTPGQALCPVMSPHAQSNPARQERELFASAQQGGRGPGLTELGLGELPARTQAEATGRAGTR